MNDKPLEPWRLRASVAETLDVFNSNYMQDVWATALARRQSEPGAAVTSARTLLESVCKHILGEADPDFNEGAPLPRLYAQTAKVLDMAPSQELAPLFNKIFTACAEVIEGMGRLRNELSDSHGRGPFGDMPDWRHAELAVNLSGAMATYLAAVWKGRQPRVSDVLRKYKAQNVGPANVRVGYTLDRICESDLGRMLAAKLRPNDIAAHFEMRAVEGKAVPTTVRREFATFRVALGGHSAEALRSADAILRRRNLLASGTHVTQVRRVPEKDFAAVVQYLKEQIGVWRDVKHVGTSTGLPDFVEFAAWSGRSPVDICRLRWADVDFRNRTCKLPGNSKPFPVLERAWDVIEQRRPDAIKSDARIFPYPSERLTMRHRVAVAALLAEGKIESSIRFQDYRHEAAHRLLGKGHSPEVVVRATGLSAARIVKIAEQMQGPLTRHADVVAI